MKHNMRRVLHLTQARDFTMRAIRAWRHLLPDWTPTLDDLRELDTRPHEHVAAVRIVASGWGAEDARWDVLLALLEYERRQEKRKWVTTLSGEAWGFDPPLDLDTPETTVETPAKAAFLGKLTVVKHVSDKPMGASDV